MTQNSGYNVHASSGETLLMSLPIHKSESKTKKIK